MAVLLSALPEFPDISVSSDEKRLAVLLFPALFLWCTIVLQSIAFGHKPPDPLKRELAPHAKPRIKVGLAFRTDDWPNRINVESFYC